ncbi:MAG: hypothetical protein HRU19_12120 [Pseudobacteriovorax sp.]|nr:hypothetical protein [Pseudobacteriovorax sp.]
MLTILLIFLVVVDLFMLGAIYFIGKEQAKPIEILKEISQEKRELKELAQSLKEDLSLKMSKADDIFKKINAVAAEAEIEARRYRETLNHEMSASLQEFSEKMEKTSQSLNRDRAAIGSLVSKAKGQRELLRKSIRQGEKLAGFFNKKVPYEQVLEEIEDKKYTDARELLSKGMPIDEVALEVGLPSSEVALISHIG